MLILLGVAPADARLRSVRPISVRIVAYIGAKVEGTRPDFDWPVTCRGKRYELYVLNLQVVNGGVSPLAIDSALSPYSIKFNVTGNSAVLQRFLSAPPRQQVLITGYLRLDRAGRYLMLDTVESAYLATPTPAG